MAMDFKVPVLVIDDFQTITRIVSTLLGQIGFKNVDQASGGSAALARRVTELHRVKTLPT